MTNSERQADVFRQDGPRLRKRRQTDGHPRGQRIGAWEDDVKIGSTAARALAHARYALALQSSMDLGPQRNERLGGGANRHEARMQTALSNWGNLGGIVSG